VIVPPVVPVPAGAFTMGSDKQRDPQASDDELPEHWETLPAYQMGKYPVTVAEYACFVRVGQRQPQDWQGQLAKLDHPVVYVSWRDALAYAAWLAQLTGQPWRLPTEAEWEKAARWDAARQVSHLYPWGDEWDTSRANTHESSIGGTTPVGQFPSGASPCGALDMVGNVWEWTSSLFRPYPYPQADGREEASATGHRVLRGGSWISHRGHARAAYRLHNAPELVNYYGGFRLAWSAPADA
jgi:formylglycine-generating enzyme required for sulfatase activity